MAVPLARPIVVKLGGSLLSLPDVVPRVTEWLGSHASKPTALIVGGGPLVDEIRIWTERQSTSVERSHWLAVHAMSLQAELFASAVVDIPLAESLAEILDSWHAGDGVVIVDPCQELQTDAGQTLPVGWHVTSDSIAAWLAIKLNASELVLLKSVGDQKSFSVKSAQKQGWIDDHFPTLHPELSAAGCAVHWVNLRHEPFVRVALTS